MDNQTYQNQMQDKRLDNIDKHIEVINHEMGSVKNDVAWLKRFFWLIATASIGGMITAIINLIVSLSKYAT
jgi:hypothetical protein